MKKKSSYTLTITPLDENELIDLLLFLKRSSDDLSTFADHVDESADSEDLSPSDTLETKPPISGDSMCEPVKRKKAKKNKLSAFSIEVMKEWLFRYLHSFFCFLLFFL